MIRAALPRFEPGQETTLGPDSPTEATILIVDDNPANLRLLQEILTRRGFEVWSATGGERALAIAAESAPDLVMLDVSMPGMDGYAVCTALKANEGTRDVPVIFLSALDDVIDKVRAFDLGAADYVTKPFEAEEVLARVDLHLQLARLRAVLEAKQRELQRQNAELARKNEELTRKNRELLRANQRTDAVFTALSEALPGTVLGGKYRLDERIGGGGYGTVYRALHLELDRPVAVKVFHPRAGNDTADALRRFHLEGMSASRLSHPNTVAILDFGKATAGIAYLVMELLDGRTLAEELRERVVLPLARAVEIAVPVCSALAAMHAAGIVHRDVKPQNIFLHRGADGAEVVKVIDFGAVKLMARAHAPEGSSITTSGQLIGTPEYISPERLGDRPYDGRADVYSLGVVVYRMLCGRVPFYAEDPYAVALMHLGSRPQPLRELNPGVPTNVEAAVLRALEKESSARPTAAEFGADLASAAAAPVVTPPGPPLNLFGLGVSLEPPTPMDEADTGPGERGSSESGDRRASGGGGETVA